MINRCAGAELVSGQPSQYQTFLAVYAIVPGPVSCQKTSMLPGDPTLVEVHHSGDVHGTLLLVLCFICS